VSGTGLESVLVLGQALTLVSWWKALLVFPPMMGWAWLVSNVFDKHAGRFYLAREQWNAGHMLAGVAALALVFLMPFATWWGFLVGYAAMLAVLALDIGLFVLITNKNEKVPEQHRLKLDFSKFAAASKAKKDAKLAATVSLRIDNASGVTVVAPQKETPEYEVRGTAETVFTRAAVANAHQAELVPASSDSYQLRFLVDGVRQAVETMPAQQAVAIMDFWKSCAELDVKDRRRRLVGSCRVIAGETRNDLRIVSYGAQGGMRLQMTIDPAKAVDRKPEDLGLLGSQMETLNTLVGGKGMVLLAAPPVNGRTTTLYTVTRMHDAYTSNVQTLELEPQTSLEGIRQVKFDPEEGIEFATTLRSILRRDPDVVSVAELPDQDTAKEAARGDMDRSRVYISVKADGALAAAQVYVKACGDAKLASEALSGVVAQKLARKLCENCRVPYQPPADLLKKIGLPEGKVSQLFKKGGQVLIRNKPEVCPVCNGVGYSGQIGVFEVFPFGAEEKAMIAEQNWSGLRAQMRKKGHPTIQQAALRRVVEGVTSVEEVSRITAPPAKKKPSKPSAA
jgi:type II secretory ATPase GspE/PulE/Tfp pilus assembly ATPase PilB-like protein